MKYDVGDKVIESSNIEFFFNPYWKKEKRFLMTVTEANEKFFSIYKPTGRHTSAIEEGLCCGANEYMVFFQSSGRTVNWASTKTYLHVEKDQGLILDMIKELGEKTFKERDKKLLDEIERCKRYREQLKVEYEKDLADGINLILEAHP